MTPLECILISLMWIFLGLFICGKTNWFNEKIFPEVKDPVGLCIVVILFAPLVFLWDLVNRFFVKKWYDD